MIRLSNTSKMSGKDEDGNAIRIRSWSLQAVDTCPGARKSNGELVDACKGCYATTGFYKTSVVMAPRIHNREDWKREDFVPDMILELEPDRYFRLFDSGDFYHVKLVEKWIEIGKASSHCKFWIPTRSYKFKKFKKVLEALDSLPNVMVRYSSDSILGEYTPGLHGSTIMPEGHKDSSITKCYAYERGGKCGSCRLCWNKDVDVIGYVQHGRKMRSVMLNKVKGE